MSEQSVHPQEFEDVLVLVSRMITGHVHVADDAGMRERLTPLLVRAAMAGTAFRHCMMLDCWSSLDLVKAYTGETPSPGWLQSTALGGYLCPDHAWLWEDHFPQWIREDRATRGQLACPCTWVSGPVTHRGLGKEMWKSHVHDVQEAQAREEAGYAAYADSQDDEDEAFARAMRKRRRGYTRDDNEGEARAAVSGDREGSQESGT